MLQMQLKSLNGSDFLSFSVAFFHAMVVAEAVPVVDGDVARPVVLIDELGPGSRELCGLLELPAIAKTDAMGTSMESVKTSATEAVAICRLSSDSCHEQGSVYGWSYVQVELQPCCSSTFLHPLCLVGNINRAYQSTGHHWNAPEVLAYLSI